MRQQGGIAPSADADLQNTLPIVDIQGFEHQCHQTRGGARRGEYPTGRLSGAGGGVPAGGVVVELGGPGRVGVDHFQPVRFGLPDRPPPGVAGGLPEKPGQEPVPRHSDEGLYSAAAIAAG